MRSRQISLARLLTLAIGACLPVAQAWSQSTVPHDILAAGKADFMTYCATCHGRDAIGNGPVAKQLITNPADLTVLTKNNGGSFPEERVHRVIDGRQSAIGHGTRDMPVWGNWFKFVARSTDPNKVDDETAEIIVALRIQGLIEYLGKLQKK